MSKSQTRFPSKPALRPALLQGAGAALCPLINPPSFSQTLTPAGEKPWVSAAQPSPRRGEGTVAAPAGGGGKSRQCDIHRPLNGRGPRPRTLCPLGEPDVGVTRPRARPAALPCPQGGCTPSRDWGDDSRHQDLDPSSHPTCPPRGDRAEEQQRQGGFCVGPTQTQTFGEQTRPGRGRPWRATPRRSDSP